MADHTKHSSDPGHAADTNPNVSHERGDIDIFQITAFGLGLFISCVVVVFAMWAMFQFLSKRADDASALTSSPMQAQRMQLPPEPRLSGIVAPSTAGQLGNGRAKAQLPMPVAPHVELGQMLSDEATILNSYGLLDPTKGIARIPIGLALDMVAQKGLPAKVTSAGGESAGFRLIPSDASGGRTMEKLSQ